MEPSLLWLLVAILTIYTNGGAYLIRYTTFEDLDMLWPGIHVGVLANISDGNLWVIHNNGEGTNRMAWIEYNRTWSTHRVELGEWRYAAPRCTVDEAVRRCSPKYNLVFDNCYNARDTVVRYFSNNATFPFQTCIPNRTYCGYQLDQKLLDPGLGRSVERSIYQCQSDGVVTDAVITCSHECTSSGDDAFCRCSPGKRYCGHELNGQGWTGYQDNTLYLCLQGGLNGTAFFACQEGRCQGSSPSIDSHCLCTPGQEFSGHVLYLMGLKIINAETDRIRLGKCMNGSYAVWIDCGAPYTYCGYELEANGWLEYDKDALYQCHGGRNASYVKSCELKCVRTERNSYCAEDRMCDANGTYCGKTLTGMGWNKADSDTIYLCGSDGKNTSILTHCPDTCIQGYRHAYCLCDSGHSYCGHDLYKKMNWWTWRAISYNKVNSWLHSWNGKWDWLARCITNRSDIEWTSNCTAGCITQENGSYCACEVNTTYCGHKLHKMGWHGYEKDALYHCHGGRNASYVKSCELNCVKTERNSSCAEDRMCDTNWTYCGKTLTEMGWKEADSDTIYLCGSDGKNTSILTHCPDTCSQGSRHAYCPCHSGRSYCGHDLYKKMNWWTWRAISYNEVSSVLQSWNGKWDRLARCTNGANVEWTSNCTAGCITQENGSYCACEVNTTYCRQKLHKMGWHGYDNSTLYRCNDGKNNLTRLGKSQLCEPCIPGRSYCGHERQYTEDIAQNKLQERYMCQQDGTFKTTAQCTTCVNHGKGAYCQCTPAWLYCGSDIYNKGWQGYGETIELPKQFNDTLFRCVDEEAMVPFAQCAKGECRFSPISHRAYCLCTPGRRYCGHEVYSRYNSEDTYLVPNNIYKCSATKQVVKKIDECGTCVSVGGMPQCRAKCVVNLHYCGKDLVSLEGWNDTSLQPNGLYICENGTTVSLERNCTAGCQLDNEGSEAYCSGEPLAWYWIVISTVLPISFVILLSLLIRGFIQHRSLKRIIRRHRIDASQLKKIEKIGTGEFGEVWKGEYSLRRHNAINVALKISKHQLGTESVNALASANCLFREVVALSLNLGHKNIIKMYGICSNLEGGKESALVLEYLNGGNSIVYLRTERKRLMSGDLSLIFTDICQACRYLGDKRIVHRDVRACNVLVQKDPRTGRPVVTKLADFGLAKDIGKASMYKITGQTAIPARYTAPEGFRFDGSITAKADVWSFGVFMWEVYMLMNEKLAADSGDPGPLPYSQIQADEDVFVEVGNGCRLERPSTAPSEAYSIMNRCWLYKPEARPTFDQLIGELEVLGDLKSPPGEEAFIPRKILDDPHPHPHSADAKQLIGEHQVLGDLKSPPGEEAFIPCKIVDDPHHDPHSADAKQLAKDIYVNPITITQV